TAATARPNHAHGRGVRASTSAGTLTPASSSPSGTTNPAEPAAKPRSARAPASAGLAVGAACALVQLISPDSASDAAASRPPARAMTAPGAVTPRMRRRRYVVADQMARGADAA